MAFTYISFWSIVLWRGFIMKATLKVAFQIIFLGGGGAGGASACLFDIATDVSIIVGFIIYHNQLQ